MMIYNSLSCVRDEWIRVPVVSSNYSVYDASDRPVEAQVVCLLKLLNRWFSNSWDFQHSFLFLSHQLVPVSSITRALWAANGYKTSLTLARYELVFHAIAIPPLGFSTYTIRQMPGIVRRVLFYS